MSLCVNHIFMFKDGKQFTSQAIEIVIYTSLSVFVVSIFILLSHLFQKHDGLRVVLVQTIIHSYS